MTFEVAYLENSIYVEDGFVNAIEIENKALFYRFVNQLNLTTNGEMFEELKLFDSNNNEVNLSNKLNVIIDYFNFDFNSKKCVNESTKMIKENIEEDEYQTIYKEYQKIYKILIKTLNKIDLSLSISDELDMDNLLKLLKININKKSTLIENLFLLIDINKVFDKKIIVFVNLKQFLKKEELIELYKYSIYNGTNILLVDSQSYGTTLDYEKKLIIDENLEEFML